MKTTAIRLIKAPALRKVFGRTLCRPIKKARWALADDHYSHPPVFATIA